MGALGYVIADGYEALRARWNPDLRELRQERTRAQLEAAKRLRYGDDLNSSAGAADDEYEYTGDREEIRDRAHAAYRDIPFAKAIVDTRVDQVVGTGLVPQVEVDYERLGLTAQQADEYQDALEGIFRRWCKVSDSGGRQSFTDQQRTIFANRLIAGDILSMPVTPARMAMRDEVETRCELIESHRLDSPYGTFNANPDTVAGVVLGPRGEPRAYYIYGGHPGSARALHLKPQETYMPRRVEAFDRLGRPRILHHYMLKRPGQTRGLSELHAVLPTLQHHAKYLQAEVVAARMAACIGLLFTTPQHEGTTPSENERAVEKFINMRPGMAPALPPGYGVESFAPNRMTASSTVPFAELLLEHVSTGVGVSYGTIAKDFRRDNFSNTRAAILMDRRSFRCDQLWVGRNICQPYLEVVAFEALMKGLLPDFVPVVSFREFCRDWCTTDWMPTPGWEWIDSKKDAETAQIDIGLGVSSSTDIARTKGTDFKAIKRKQLKEELYEKELREELGLPEPTPPGAMQQQSLPLDDDDPDDTTDDDMEEDADE